ncbi:MAG: hypothetical protein ACI3YD_05885 [Alloprevotella sp.]
MNKSTKLKARREVSRHCGVVRDRPFHPATSFHENLPAFEDHGSGLLYKPHL